MESKELHNINFQRSGNCVVSLARFWHILSFSESDKIAKMEIHVTRMNRGFDLLFPEQAASISHALRNSQKITRGVYRMRIPFPASLDISPCYVWNNDWATRMCRGYRSRTIRDSTGDHDDTPDTKCTRASVHARVHVGTRAYTR